MTKNNENNVVDVEGLKKAVNDAKKQEKVKERIQAFRAEVATSDDAAKENLLAFIEEKCSDETFFNAFLDQRKTFKDCLYFVFDKAKKEFEKTSKEKRGMSIVKGDTVYHWVEEYFLTPFDELPKLSEPSNVSIATMAGAKKDSKKTTKKSEKATTSPSNEPKKDSKETTKSKESKEVPKKTTKPKKKSDTHCVDGQMDIFSFL